MRNITVLDKNTINQIAAGEVVERPCSVVKELVENAIDAKATAVTVEIKEGGIQLIRVSDNGSGIEKEDIKTAFLRHSTSKLKTAEDLLTISSLGFRGEALSSISSVAQVELVTKTRTSFTGSRYIIDAGEEKEFSEIGCPEGTTFIIRDLFYNTPARRKFLKSPMTEAGYISDLMERLAVSHPYISFKYINNNKTLLHTSGNGNLKDIIYHVYGRDITSNLLETDENINNIRITGFIGKPAVSRGNRNYENYFINGRYIKSNIISKAIEEAYKPYTMQHKYPFTVLNIFIDSTFIDVNVHPTKMEIRFANGEDVYRTVFTVIKNALSGKNMIPHVTLGKTEKETLKTYENIPEPFEKARIEKTLTGKDIRQQNKSEREREINEMNKSRFMEDVIGIKNIPYQQKEEKPVQQTLFEASYTYAEGADATENNTVSEPEISKMINEAEAADTAEKNSELVQKDKIADIDKIVEKDNIAEKDNVAKKDNIVKKDNIAEKDNVAEKDKIIEKTDELIKTGEMQNALKMQNVLSMVGHRIIGQLFSTYWLVEYDGQLYIIDQHAAHEKILYEDFMNRLKKNEFLSQIVSPPIILTLSQREAIVLNEHKKILEDIGFEIEPFGGKEYAVSSIPADMLNIDGKELILSFLDGLVEDASVKTPDIILERVASMACKAAVKGNHKMSKQEAEEMINRLMTLDNPFHCPHGRPIIISMTKNEIEKKFKRIL